MHLETVQNAVAQALRELPELAMRPVLADDEGDILNKLALDISKTNFAVVVGVSTVASNQGDAPSSPVSGTHSINVDIYERPVLSRRAPEALTALQAAQLVAEALHCLPVDGGVLAFRRIGPASWIEERTLVRTVSFDVLASGIAGTLDGYTIESAKTRRTPLREIARAADGHVMIEVRYDTRYDLTLVLRGDTEPSDTGLAYGGFNWIVDSVETDETAAAPKRYTVTAHRHTLCDTETVNQ